MGTPGRRGRLGRLDVNININAGAGFVQPPYSERAITFSRRSVTAINATPCNRGTDFLGKGDVT